MYIHHVEVNVLKKRIVRIFTKLYYSAIIIVNVWMICNCLQKVFRPLVHYQSISEATADLPLLRDALMPLPRKVERRPVSNYSTGCRFCDNTHSQKKVLTNLTGHVFSFMFRKHLCRLLTKMDFNFRPKDWYQKDVFLCYQRNCLQKC